MSEDDRTIPQIDAEISHYQGKIDAIKEAREPNVPDSKPTIFDHSGDAKLTSEMGKIFDKSTGKAQLADEQKTVPSVQPGDSLDSAFEKTWDHLHSTETQKATIADAHKLVEQVRENAARFGVTLTDEQAMSKAMELEYVQQQEAKAEAGNPYNGAAEAMRSVYKDHDPNQTATWFAQVKQSFDSDPIAATAWAAEQYGLTPLQLAQQIYQRYGQQQNQPTQQDVARVQAMVEQEYAQNPRMEELGDDILAELKSSKLTGDRAADLRRAVQKAEAKSRKRSTSDRLGRSMESIYDRKAGRK